MLKNIKVMEMKRSIYNELLRWKQRTERKPLILLGARQVGKTYILKKFGEAEYDHLIYINCHRNAFAESLFANGFDIPKILHRVSLFYETDIIPGRTLLFFDEIQEIPQGIPSLKYFCEDAPEQHVVVAGSLLGITLRHGESYPVGKVNTLKMFPMTFSEFLNASGRTKLRTALDSLDYDTIRILHDEFADLLRQYYFTGGMPEAVRTYLSTHDTEETRRVQHEILDAYENDMAKHTATETQRIRMVWNSIPSQLARERKKFKYSDVAHGARAREYEIALQWLVDAGLVYKVERAKQPIHPLKFYADNSAFKIYMNDCGLLAAMYDAQPRDMLLGNQVFESFKGAFTENYVLQQLIAHDSLPVFYYSKDNSTMEVDFLVQTPHRIIPTEVKAEENVKSKSLSAFVTHEFGSHQLKGLRCSMKSYIDQGWMENIPLYAVEAYFHS